LASGIGQRYFLYVGNGVLCNLFCKRYLRIYKLAENELAAAENIIKDQTYIKKLFSKYRHILADFRSKINIKDDEDIS